MVGYLTTELTLARFHMHLMLARSFQNFNQSNYFTQLYKLFEAQNSSGVTSAKVCS